MVLKEALDILIYEKNAMNFANSFEFIQADMALGRVLAEDITAKKDLPCFDNSALDGYAVRFEEAKKGYVLIGSVFAGEDKQTKISGNECVKVMTGAMFPMGADTVIRLEDSFEKDGKIYSKKELKFGDAHRFKGEEIKSGEVILKSGEFVNSTKVMLLASQGISTIKVKVEPKIAIFSSGDEIKEPWEFAKDSEIYNANAFGIKSLLLENGFKSSYLGIIKDDLNETKKAFEENQNFDILICSGGASKGEADFMKTTLITLGYKELFSHINIRPGAPAKAFKKDNQIVFILPGNPMAAYMMAFLLVIPFLKGVGHKSVKAICKEKFKVKSGRANVVLGSLIEGEFYLTNSNNYGSGMISPLVKSNAFYLSSIDENGVEEGQEIFVFRLS